MNTLKRFWSDAVLSAYYLIKLMPSSILDSASPHCILLPSSPLFSFPPKIFGCTYYVHNLGFGFNKLDTRATKYVFLGYSRTQNGYRCYSPVLRGHLTSADLSFLNLHHISSLLVLLMTLFLCHPLFHLLSCVPYPLFIQSYCLHYLLLTHKFTLVAQGHLLLCLHQFSRRLQIRFHHLSQNRCLLLSEKVQVLVSPITPLVILVNLTILYWSLMFTNTKQVIYSICILIEIRGMT